MTNTTPPAVVEARMKLLKRLPWMAYFERHAERDANGKMIGPPPGRFAPQNRHATASETTPGEWPGYRVLCGRTFLDRKHPCEGLLGYAYEYVQEGRPSALSMPWATRQHAGEPLPNPGDWLLNHPEGLRRLEDGSYRVVGGGKSDSKHIYGHKRGRRPVPADILVPRMEGHPNRSIIGRFATLPAFVHCPKCTVPQPNLVNRPGAL